MNNILNITQVHFQPYMSTELKEVDLIEICENFQGFAKLLLKLEEKRKSTIVKKGVIND